MNARLVEALELHKKWLEGEPSGRQFCYDDYKDIKVVDEFIGADLRSANFTNASLFRVNFNGADLSDARFTYANLVEASFSEAKLIDTDFEETNLHYASFRDANLDHTIFRGANLTESYFTFAKLSHVNFFYANLCGSELSYTTIFFCNFQNANLDSVCFDRADLKNSTFCGSNLTGVRRLETVKNFNTIEYDSETIGLTLACPEKGEYIGYKSCKGKIVELRIPADALRSSATTKKCRASKAEVLGITEFDGNLSDVDSVASDYDENFIYKVGETVEVKDFDTNRWCECSTGIHHFITREEAILYYYIQFKESLTK